VAGRVRRGLSPRATAGARRALLVLALAAVAVTVAALALRSPRSVPAAAKRAVATLPAPVTPAFVPGRPRPLGSQRDAARIASVRHATQARSAPGPDAAVVAELSTRTPEGTDNVVAVTAHRQDATGAPWVRVRLAILPNGSTGWVPRAALGGYVTVHTRLDLDLEHLRATLYRRGRAVLRAPIGAGMPGWPTPRGSFYIRDRLTRYRSPMYGPVAFGTSARSPAATDWPAGGYVGIHGTDRPDLIPGRVSHGCVRMRNADIVRLARRMPVGTPVRVF
jgi:lipoprotein-anchoring transpeptidase ErfK/SrfK